jgi:ribosome-associated translation inhibitor RaiA
MHIQVHTDNHIEGDERLSEYAESGIQLALGHLADRVTRVDAHLADENGDKGSGRDKRCTLEAHVAGQPPVTTTHHAASVRDAFEGAAAKLERLLAGIEDRRRDKHPSRG